MTKEESIKKQNDFIHKMEMMIEDIKKYQDSLIDYDDSIIDRESLQMSLDEDVIGMYNWYKNQKRVDILTIKELGLICRTRVIEDGKLTMNYYGENK